MSKKSILEGSEVHLDKRTGIPKKVRGEFALPVAYSNEASVKAFLVGNAGDLKLDATDKDLSMVQDVSLSTGRVMRFQQSKNGIPIFGAEIVVRVDKNERIKQLDLNHVSPVLDSTLDRDEKKLTIKEATKFVTDSIGEYTLRQKHGKPEQIYYPTSNGLKLAYLVLLLTEEPLHDWQIIVDAHRGEILKKDDLIVYMPDGQGLVFDPNPVVTSGDNTLRDPTATVATCGFAGTAIATIDAERVSRTLKDITLSGGTHKLEGPYVKLRHFGGPTVAPPEEVNANDFNYSSGDAAFEAVMVYYHVDTMQRYIQSLGITTAHNSQIEADAHDSSGSYQGAWFSPADGGIHFGNSGNCKPDRGEEADAMIHEYGHAIQNDQVPGWGVTNPTTNRRETRAMGEGFGDILACVYFAPDHLFQREVFEDWCFADEGGMRSVNGTKVYPWNIASGTGGDWTNGEHADGEIWSAALWNIYRALGGDSVTLADRVAARDEVLRTVINSHHRLSSNSTMPDGAEAFMEENAELEVHRLQNGIDILDNFHDRGLLHCEAGSDLKIDSLWSQQDDLSVRSWEQVEAGQDNWFYATVHNASATTTARAFVITFSFKSPFATPVYPADFRDNIISAACVSVSGGFELAPGATATVKARWPKEMIPPIPSGATQRHGCILAEVYNPEDHVAAGVTSIGASNGKLKQRNTNIVDLLPDETADFFLDTSNYKLQHPELARLEIIREPRWQHVEISLHHPNKKYFKEFIRRAEYVKPRMVRPVGTVVGIPELRVLERTRVEIEMGKACRPLIMDLAPGSSMPLPEARATGDMALEDAFVAPVDPEFMRMDADWVPVEAGAQLSIRPGLRVGFPLVMKPRDRTLLNIKIKAPKNARAGDSFTVVVRQRNKKGELLGEFDVQVNIVERKKAVVDLTKQKVTKKAIKKRVTKGGRST